MRRHLVWDWNGTLLDDLEIVLEGVNAGLAAFGVPPIDGDRYRSLYTRPVRFFYERLLGGSMADDDWTRINELYFQTYLARAEEAALVPDARQALRRASRAGVDQSLLSMAPHDHLVPMVRRHRLTDFFSHVQGTMDDRGGVKAANLGEHLVALGLEGDEVVMIGDTPDDAAAAAAVGAAALLYDGGSHHRHDLEAVGVPVTATLTEAVEMAISSASGTGFGPTDR